MDEATELSPSPAAALAESRAFRLAALRSETQRAYAVIAVVVLVLTLAMLPNVSQRIDIGIRVIALIGVGVLLAMQVAALLVVRRARALDSGLPTGFLVSSVFIESLIPGGMILWNILHGSLLPYSSLSAPPILAYGIMILLTTLRLRPVLCILAGGVGALSYSAILVYVTRGLHQPNPTTGLPYAAYINTAVLIFITGFAGAWVTREIRRHLDAALGEAVLRHKMDRMEQDLSIARTIQQALLPRVAPDVPGFDIAGWNRSADQTGGDYYDWQALPDGNWMITLADVSGHGIGPAMVTAACRAYSRASSFYNADLASLTARMNRLLADDLPDGRFVTMVTVLIDGKGGPLQLLSAGHGPIVLYVGSSRSVQDIMPHDLPLAIMSDAEFGPAQSVTLRHGDVLALVTDGFVEWSRPGGDDRREQFGMTRLRESMGRHAHLSASGIIQAVAADVAAFSRGEPQQDDLTMVVIKHA